MSFQSTDRATTLYSIWTLGFGLVAVLLFWKETNPQTGLTVGFVEMMALGFSWVLLHRQHSVALMFEPLRLSSLALLSAFALRHAATMGPFSLSALWLGLTWASLCAFSRLPLTRRAVRLVPFTERTPRQTTLDRACAAAIFFALTLYALQKHRANLLQEMLFGCHVTACLAAIGLCANRRQLVGLGLVFAVGVGIPMWVFYVATTRDTNSLSVFLHLFPAGAAISYVRRCGLPKRAWCRAWFLFLLLLLASACLTDPALNVNLAHKPSPELLYLIPSLWGARFYGVLLVGSLLFAAQFGLSCLLGQTRQPVGAHEQAHQMPRNT